MSTSSRFPRCIFKYVWTQWTVFFVQTWMTIANSVEIFLAKIFRSLFKYEVGQSRCRIADWRTFIKMQHDATTLRCSSNGMTRTIWYLPPSKILSLHPKVHREREAQKVCFLSPSQSQNRDYIGLMDVLFPPKCILRCITVHYICTVVQNQHKCLI